MPELYAKAGAPAELDVSIPPDAPPLAPCDAEIDRAHLARMTQGERELEREVLALFATQTEILLGRMQGANARLVGALAHTLCGSARGIGAWKVAEAAATVEADAAAGRDATAAVERLAAAARHAQTEIAELMRPC